MQEKKTPNPKKNMEIELSKELQFEDLDLDKSIGGHSVVSFVCPQCKHKRLKRYIQVSTLAYLAGNYGRCDRDNNCGYHLMPWDDLRELKNLDSKPRKSNGTIKNTRKPINVAKIEEKEPNFVDYQKFVEPTCKHVAKTELFRWFSSHFGEDYARFAFERYLVGANKSGYNVFWQVDAQLRARSDNQILYRGFNRVKEVHPMKKFKVSDGYKPCFFGEHLLYYSNNLNPLIFIVESEKTALLCSLYLPTVPTKQGERFAFWLACSGSNGMTAEKIKALQGLDVVLVPDFHYKNRMEWGVLPMRKLDKVVSLEGEIVQDYKSMVDKILAVGAKTCKTWDVCPERNDGADIADYLIESVPWNPDAYPSIEEQKELFMSVAKVEIVAQEETFEPSEYKDPRQVIIENMVRKNPDIALLMNVLSLD